MTVTLMGHTFNSDALHSCIIGEHGKEPWDFEFTVPALPSYAFLQDCIYKPVVINSEHLFRGGAGGIVTYDSADIKSEYIVTKVEYNTDEAEDVYIISGIEEPAYVLKNNIAINDTEYQTPESSEYYLARVLETFTSAKWSVRMWYPVDFKPIKSGEFLSEWFWSNAKKSFQLIDFKKLGPNSYSIKFYEKNQKPKLLNKFVSAKRVKENMFNNAYIKANDIILTKRDPVKNKLFYNTVFTGTYPKTTYTLDFPFENINKDINLDDIFYPLLNKVFHQGHYTLMTRYFFSENAAGYPGWIMVIPVAGDYYPVELKFNRNVFIPEYIANQFKSSLLKVYGSEGAARIEKETVGKYDPVSESIDYGWDFQTTSPYISSRLSNENIGQFVTGFVLAQLVPGRSRTFEIPKVWYDLFAAYGVNSAIDFPENRFKSDYELNEKQQGDIFIGDEVVTMYGDDAICTDKVISYEEGEIKYDVTIKDPVELRRE